MTQKRQQGTPLDHDLSFSCSRRQFLPALLREAIVTLGMLGGGDGCRLADLDDMSNESLGQITPIVNPACEIITREGVISARFHEADRIVRLFPEEEFDNVLTLSLFDGKHSLGEAGEQLAQEMGWDTAQGFAHARNLFLFLVSHVVCVPSEPVQLVE